MHIKKMVDAFANLDNAERQVRSSMLEAHESGLTWAAIAEALDLPSGEAARARAQPRLVNDAHAEPLSDEPYDPPGVNVSEAATRLGVTRKTVYAWIDRGELRSTTDRAGRTRVLLDDQQAIDD